MFFSFIYRYIIICVQNRSLYLVISIILLNNIEIIILIKLSLFGLLFLLNEKFFGHRNSKEK